MKTLTKKQIKRALKTARKDAAFHNEKVLRYRKDAARAELFGDSDDASLYEAWALEQAEKTDEYLTLAALASWALDHFYTNAPKS